MGININLYFGTDIKSLEKFCKENHLTIIDKDGDGIFTKKDTLQYQVQKGESYWAIARKFDGQNAKQLQEKNGKSSSLKIGQNITIWAGKETQTPAVTSRPKYTKEEIQAKIRAKAKENGVDENLAIALAEQESKFNSNATSKTGAAGIFQLTPTTASEVGVKDIYNSDENINGGINYLKWCIDNTSTEEEALVAYNKGLGGLRAAKKAGKNIDSITDRYTTVDGREIGFAQAVSEKKTKYETEANRN